MKKRQFIYKKNNFTLKSLEHILKGFKVERVCSINTNTGGGMNDFPYFRSTISKIEKGKNELICYFVFDKSYKESELSCLNFIVEQKEDLEFYKKNIKLNIDEQSVNFEVSDLGDYSLFFNFVNKIKVTKDFKVRLFI
jgi:hypothetical protein|nr:MAG TPA: hypothetical protein [Caudoviricetes sp.]